MESYKSYVAEDRSGDSTAASEQSLSAHAVEEDPAVRVVGGRRPLPRSAGPQVGGHESIASVPELLGAFAYEALRSEGLEGIAELITLGAQLDEAQGDALQRASLPALGKLLELQQLVRAHERGHDRLPVRRRFILYTPFAETIERSGRDAAIRECGTRLIELAQKAAPSFDEPGKHQHDTLLIALDRWVGDFTNDSLLGAVAELLKSLRENIETLSPFVVGFFGPTTGELKQMLRGRDSVPSRLITAEIPGLQQLLARLRAAGIESIEGGGDLTVLHTALTSGLDVTVTHDLSRFRLAAHGAQPTAERSLLSSLLEARARLCDDIESRAATRNGVPAGRWRCWYPWLPSALDSTFRADAPLGLEVVTAVALARLLVPDLDYVGAPLSLCGPNATEVAHHFGANDIGFIAPDAESAAHLGVASHDPKSDALYRRLSAVQRAQEEQWVSAAEEVG